MPRPVKRARHAPADAPPSPPETTPLPDTHNNDMFERGAKPTLRATCQGSAVHVGPLRVISAPRNLQPATPPSEADLLRRIYELRQQMIACGLGDHIEYLNTVGVTIGDCLMQKVGEATCGFFALWNAFCSINGLDRTCCQEFVAFRDRLAAQHRCSDWLNESVVADESATIAKNQPEKTLLFLPSQDYLDKILLGFQPDAAQRDAIQKARAQLQNGQPVAVILYINSQQPGNAGRNGHYVAFDLVPPPENATPAAPRLHLYDSFYLSDRLVTTCAQMVRRNLMADQKLVDEIHEAFAPGGSLSQYESSASAGQNHLEHLLPAEAPVHWPDCARQEWSTRMSQAMEAAAYISTLRQRIDSKLTETVAAHLTDWGDPRRFVTPMSGDAKEKLGADLEQLPDAYAHEPIRQLLCDLGRYVAFPTRDDLVCAAFGYCSERELHQVSELLAREKGGRPPTFPESTTTVEPSLLIDDPIPTREIWQALVHNWNHIPRRDMFAYAHNQGPEPQIPDTDTVPTWMIIAFYRCTDEIRETHDDDSSSCSSESASSQGSRP